MGLAQGNSHTKKLNQVRLFEGPSKRPAKQCYF